MALIGLFGIFEIDRLMSEIRSLSKKVLWMIRNETGWLAFLDMESAFTQPYFSHSITDQKAYPKSHQKTHECIHGLVSDGTSQDHRGDSRQAQC